MAGLAIVKIGHDDIESLNYSAAIGLEVLPGGMSELYFHIVEADSATDAEYVFWSGRDTKFIASAEDRQAVLSSILTGLRDLLVSVEPAEFVWFTSDEDMPRKALLKFGAIRQVVARCGYRVTSEQLSAGRKAWHASRVEGVAIDSGEGEPNPIDLRE